MHCVAASSPGDEPWSTGHPPLGVEELEETEVWLHALRSAISSRDKRQAFRDRRFAFSHRVGTTLRHWVSASGGDRPIVYGVCLGEELVYVGQTCEPSRRLYDLPIGESHHLANTFPPEVWDRVVVFDWARQNYCDALPQEQPLAHIGEAIEFLLHRHYRPEMNVSRKGTLGNWIPRNLVSRPLVAALECCRFSMSLRQPSWQISPSC